MKPCNTTLSLVLLNALCVAGYCCSGLERGRNIHVNQSELTRSVSPHGQWEFFMKPSPDEDRGPTMWIARRHERKATFVGNLFRDGDLQWCPKDACLILIEEPSIEYMQIKLYRLDPTGPQAFPALNRAISEDVKGSIAKHSEILFSGLRVLGWVDEQHVLIAAQARYWKSGNNAQGGIFTCGYVVEVDTGKVSRRISAGELKAKYGFSKRIV